ncbi:hypothetical protein ABMA28_000329 [Loxostege sticticalis]|uniref:Uncharacterized protein n=1 Tax=Loxostege sticticalis TaxID=481309 RepID=A0ABD0TSB4_LOXSC
MKRCWSLHVPLVIVESFTRLILVDASGLLLLYRPNDISNDCLISHHLRYDISFGHGLSDTITLVFRTLSEIDYECLVEIVADSPIAYLLTVIRFPNPIGVNCLMNGDAFTIFKQDECLRICDYIGDRDTASPYFVITVKRRLSFRFISNSSINSDMDANYYQVTATSARKWPKRGCDAKNETICVTSEDKFCFTSGVVCDGIKNCGITDWYDERRSDCDETVKRIGYAPVVAVLAIILCVLLACGHLMLRWLPPLANSFFIFNANEDNRLCIDPVFIAPDFAPCDIERARKISIIPVSSSSSENTETSERQSGVDLEEQTSKKALEELEDSSDQFEETRGYRRKTTMRGLTEMFQQRLRSVASKTKRFSKTFKSFSTAVEEI